MQKLKPTYIDSDSFRNLILYNDVFIDKNLLIKDVLDDPWQGILITCPRRWNSIFLNFTPKTNSPELYFNHLEEVYQCFLNNLHECYS